MITLIYLNNSIKITILCSLCIQMAPILCIMAILFYEAAKCLMHAPKLSLAWFKNMFLLSLKTQYGNMKEHVWTVPYSASPYLKWKTRLNIFFWFFWPFLENGVLHFMFSLPLLYVYICGVVQCISWPWLWPKFWLQITKITNNC